MATETTPEVSKMLKKWLERSRRIQNRHYEASSELQRWHYGTGAPLVVLSVVEGSTLLATITELTSLSTYAAMITGLLGLTVAVLAAMQAFMSFETRSRLHYLAGVKYGEIKRQLEVQLLADPSGAQTAAHLEELRLRWDSLTEESPPIPLSVWRRGDQEEKERKKKRQDKKPANSANTAS